MILPTPITAALDALKAAGAANLTGLAVAAVCLPVGHCHGVSAERAAWEKKVSDETIARQKAALAEERQREIDAARGAAAIATQRKELDDATADLPDRALTDRQLARFCAERMRAGKPCADTSPAR